LYPGKADILRYELLYKYGGVYIDADCDCLNPLDDYLRQFHFFVGYENEYFFPGLIATTIMGSEPEHPLLAQLINNVSKIEDVNSDHSWITVGPKFLTANIRQYEALNSPIKKLPCYKFYPIHWSGWNYKGKGKVYSTHHWISTTNIQKFEYDSSKKGPTHDGNS
jgi:mannosyltransferase OCH1-like enzyme